MEHWEGFKWIELTLITYVFITDMDSEVHVRLRLDCESN